MASLCVHDDPFDVSIDAIISDYPKEKVAEALFMVIWNEKKREMKAKARAAAHNTNYDYDEEHESDEEMDEEMQSRVKSVVEDLVGICNDKANEGIAHLVNNVNVNVDKHNM